jgi:menaquinone-dependent protoporphyrinogen oxidase
MTRVQVVYASRHGGTAGIAERIEDVLRRRGLEVVIVNASAHPDPAGFDAYVIGSAVYMGRWLDEGLTFIERNRATLATKPTWLFSSGPVAVVKVEPGEDPLEPALGPADGPGSGGHKRIAAVSTVIQPRDHHVFSGCYDPSDPAKSFGERIGRMMGAKALPAADFRDWIEIEKWAHGIASALGRTDVSVAQKSAATSG